MSGFEFRKFVPFAIIAVTMIVGVTILFLMPTVGPAVLGLNPGKFPVPVLVATGVMVSSPGVYAIWKKKVQR